MLFVVVSIRPERSIRQLCLPDVGILFTAQVLMNQMVGYDISAVVNLWVAATESVNYPIGELERESAFV